MSVAERIRELIEAPLAANQTEVVDIEYGHGLLRVTIDRTDGVDLDAVTTATEQINAVLDATDPIADSYTLEVSSPGIERPLRTPEHFVRFVGETVNVKTKTPIDGQRRFSGQLIAASPEEIVVGETTIPFAEIDKARLVANWDDAFRAEETKGA